MAQPASRGPGRPPAAKAAETRKRILRAAREVFSERGYDGATFQAIAIRADLTRPAINHYFSNKRALYREVAKETNAVVVADSIQRARLETTLIGRLSAFVDAATQADIENRTAAAFLITVALESQRHPELRPIEEADSLRPPANSCPGRSMTRSQVASWLPALRPRRSPRRCSPSCWGWASMPDLSRSTKVETVNRQLQQLLIR